MSRPEPSRCPDCGGNLYLEPDLIEAMADLVCLQCSRRFHQSRGPRSGPASRLLPGDRAASGVPTNQSGDSC